MKEQEEKSEIEKELEGKIKLHKWRELIDKYAFSSEVKRQIEIQIADIKPKLYKCELQDTAFCFAKQLRALRIVKESLMSDSDYIKERFSKKYHGVLTPEEEIESFHRIISNIENKSILPHAPHNTCLDSIYLATQKFFEQEIINGEKEAIRLELENKE